MDSENNSPVFQLSLKACSLESKETFGSFCSREAGGRSEFVKSFSKGTPLCAEAGVGHTTQGRERAAAATGTSREVPQEG